MTAAASASARPLARKNCCALFRKLPALIEKQLLKARLCLGRAQSAERIMRVRLLVLPTGTSCLTVDSLARTTITAACSGAIATAGPSGSSPRPRRAWPVPCPYAPRYQACPDPFSVLNTLRPPLRGCATQKKTLKPDAPIYAEGADLPIDSRDERHSAAYSLNIRERNVLGKNQLAVYTEHMD